MIKAEIDITEQVKGFMKFAEQNDFYHASDEIMLICRKANMKPRETLKQIKTNARLHNYDACYNMADKILNALDEERDRYKRKSEVIENAVEDIKIGLDEISHSGDPVWIKNFIDAIKLDLKEIESVL